MIWEGGRIGKRGLGKVEFSVDGLYRVLILKMLKKILIILCERLVNEIFLWLV